MNDNNPQIYTIELIGSYTARHVESEIANDQSNRRLSKGGKSPIAPLCRELIAKGHNPNAPTVVVRRRVDGSIMTIFKGNRTLGRWAELDCSENERHGPQVGRFKPFTGFGSEDEQREAA